MILLRLFFEFFKTGLFAVGGGLATLPFLYEISDSTGWFTHTDIANMIAVSESTPGAIGINMSTYAGYKTAGILGAFTATIGLATPSIIIILIVARLLTKFSKNPKVQKVFYGLRPASIAMVTAAGLNVFKISFLNIEAFEASRDISTLFVPASFLFGILFFIGLQKLKLHPIVFLGLSAVIGIIFHLG